MFWKKKGEKDQKKYEVKMTNLRKSGTFGGEGTMDEAVMKIGRIIMEKGLDEESKAEIAAILESEVRCAKCSGRFKLATGWKTEPGALVKVACPYCNCDAAIRME